MAFFLPLSFIDVFSVLLEEAPLKKDVPLVDNLVDKPLPCFNCLSTSMVSLQTSSKEQYHLNSNKSAISQFKPPCEQAYFAPTILGYHSC